MLRPGNQPVNKEVYLDLLEKADSQGYLTTQDLLEAYRLVDGEVGDSARLVAFFTNEGVEILDEIEEEEKPDPAIVSSFVEANPGRGLEAFSYEDTIDIYLREMSRVPLLDVEDEIFLAERIEKGRKAEKLLANSPTKPSLKKRSELEMFIQDGILAPRQRFK